MYEIFLLLATMYELVNHPTLTVLPCLSSDINNPVREGGSIITPPWQMITQVQRRDSLTYDPWGQHLPFVKIIDSISLRKKIPTKFIWAFSLQSILIIILSLLYHGIYS